MTRVRIKKEVAPHFQTSPLASSLPFPPSLLFLSPGLSCSGTARGADGPSVIQRGMFHVHLAQAQIPPAGKLFSGQPPVIRGLESTAQHNIALSFSSSSSLYLFFCSSPQPLTSIFISIYESIYFSLSKCISNFSLFSSLLFPSLLFEGLHLQSTFFPSKTIAKDETVCKNREWSGQ